MIYFFPLSWDVIFDSYLGLFALIFLYFAFILTFYFPFSLFLTPFFLFIPFLPFSFTFSPIFSFPFHIFSPKWHQLIFSPGGRIIFQYIDPCIQEGSSASTLARSPRHCIPCPGYPSRISNRVLSLCNMYLKYQPDELAIIVFPENSGFFLVVRNWLTEKSSVVLSVIRQFYSCNLSGDVWVYVYTYIYAVVGKLLLKSSWVTLLQLLVKVTRYF